MNIETLLRQGAAAASLRRGGDDVCIVGEPEQAPLCYGELLNLIAQTAGSLRASGIQRQDRVALLQRNGPEAATAFLAVASCCACAPLNPDYREAELEFYLKDLGPRMLVVGAGLPEAAVRVAERLGIPVVPLVVEAGSPAGWFRLAAAGSGGGGDILECPGSRPGQGQDSDYHALLLHTSGTTSRPKLVPLTSANLCRSAENIATWLGLTPQDRCLNVMPLFHIHGLIAAVLSSLRAGAAVACTKGFQAPQFLEWLETYQPTWYTAVPTMHQAILATASGRDGSAIRSSLQFIRSSSASLPPQVMRDLETTFGVPVVEAYGMTEAAHQMASNPRDAGRPRKPGSVGLPAGPEVTVRNERGEECATGAGGEVCIRGENVTPGYVDNPKANADAFWSDGGWFRTGDLGWIDSDGYLFLTGRSKEIINRGGEKISPREIDEVLLENPAVAQCLVFALPDPKLGEEVGAAVVVRTATTEAELQDWVAARLADFKVPRRVFFMDDIPRGATGKLQRIGMAGRLGISEEKDWRIATTPNTLAASAETIALVAAAMARVLRREQPAAHDADFFDLGGDSILGTQLLARIHQASGVWLTPVDLFRNRTAAQLAAAIEASTHDNAAGRDEDVVPLEAGDGLTTDLSFGQVRLWFLEEFEAGEHTANLRPALYELRGGPVDGAALESAIRTILERHEPLCTAIVGVDGTPYPMTLPASDFSLAQFDWSGLPEAKRERVATDWCNEDAQQPFQMRRELLLRASLHTLAADRHWLFVVMSHIASDGWSSEVFLSELAALLRGEDLPALPLRYSDFARWERSRLEEGSRQYTKLTAYWRNELDGLSGVAAVPCDFVRRGGGSRRGAVVRRTLPATLTAGLRELSRQHGSTLFMTLLAGFQILLSRHSGVRDVCVGTPVAGRPRIEFEGLIGLFMNTLPLRARLGGDPTLREFLDTVRRTCLEAYAHQDLPFDRLVEAVQPERTVHHMPFFHAMFQLRNVPKAKHQAHGIAIEPLLFDSAPPPVDMNLEVTETGDTLLCSLQYDAGLYRAGTAAAILRQYEELLLGAARNPEQKVSAMALAAPEELEQLRHAGWGPRVECPQLTIHELVERQAAERGSEIALAFRDERVTYDQLNRRANRLARLLQSRGLGHQGIAAICMHRSPELIVAMLAVLKCGAAYLPLNPDDPVGRLQELAEDSGSAMVLRDSVTLAHDAEGFSDANLGEGNTSVQDLAYVLYTSGSTGRPKAVEIEHRQVVNFLFAYSWTRLAAAEGVLFHTSPVFDLTGFEVWGPLTVGGRCVVYDEPYLTPARLGALVREHPVTCMWFTSSVFNYILDEDPEALHPVRRIVIGGEALSAEHVRKARRVLPTGTVLVNGYGPTECTILCTGYEIPAEVPEDWSNIPIGTPMANSFACVMDTSGGSVAGMVPAPAGVAGELCVGGACLGRGYRGRPDLTAERFVPSPFADAEAPVLYRTGDLARWRPDGLLEFLGRIDHQVKVRGVRVEPGEVESALRKHPMVSLAGVTVHEHPAAGGGATLAAYVQLQMGAQLAAGPDLLAFLRDRLPPAMVPASVTVLETMPLLASGKIDRKALGRLVRNHPVGGPRKPAVAPSSEVELRLATIWKELLGREPESIEESFFALGGHSLLALRLSVRVEKQFGRALPLRMIFERPSLRDQAIFVSQEC